MDNIERFNRQAAKIFGQLYRAFPVPIAIDCREIVSEWGPIRGPVHVDDLQRATTNPDIVFCTHTLRWLHETGYLTGSPSIHHVRMENAVLSAKGFEALAATPSSAEGKGPLGKRLADLASDTARDGVKDGIKKQIADLIGAAIGYGLGLR